MQDNIVQIQFIDTFGQTGPQGIIDVGTNYQFILNFAVGDITDPFAKKGTKSYKFTIPGTKENNQLLNNYFEVNILDGTYDHNRKQKVVVLRNGTIILDNVYLHLLNIKKVATNTEFSDQLVSYEVEVGDNATSFFTDITNKFLSDLDFSDMNHVYNSDNVVASFPYSSIRNNTLGTGGYKYVLPYIAPSTTTGALPHTGKQYPLEDCKPAISVYEYWNRIHQLAGYTWDWSGYDSAAVRMNKLYIPYNGDAPQVHDQQNYEVVADTITSVPYTNTTTGFSSIPITPVILDNEIIDVLNQYNPGTGLFTSLLYTGTAAIDVKFEVTYSFTMTNPSTHNVILVPTVGFFAYSGYDIRVGMKNTTSGTNFSTRVNFTTPILLVPGTTTVVSGTVITQIMPITNVNISDIFNIFTELVISPSGSPIWEDVSTGAAITVTNSLTVSYIKMQLIPRADTYGYGIDLNMNDFVPSKVKQSDFIKGICNMYNLVVSTDPANSRKLVYKPRDSYYDAGIIKDWTNKVVTDKEAALSFISDVNSKKIILTYKADTDDINKNYTTAYKEIYGQLEYTLENDNIKGTETKEILFSPTPVAQTQFGAYTPIINGLAPKTNIRILLDGGVQATTTPYDIIDYNYSNTPAQVSTNTGLTTYPMLTHMDNPNTPEFDINFGLCDVYYFPFTSQTNNNLYSMFWRRTIGQVNAGKLLMTYVYLNEFDIANLRLNDKIWIKDTYYNINLLQYDPNSTGPTKVTLMTIDDKLKLIPPSQSHLAASNTLLNVAAFTFDIFQNISRDRFNHLNWNYSDASVNVFGVGNIVTADINNTIILGDNKSDIPSNSLASDNVYTDTLVARSVTINGTTITSNIWNQDTGLESIIAINTLFPNTASGDYAVALGRGTTASGPGSFAAGGTSIASGNFSFAIGTNVEAAGNNSFAGGSGLLGGAFGIDSFSFGSLCHAVGNYSVAMGDQNNASGASSVALGRLSVASGSFSFAAGDSTLASAFWSFAIGSQTTASGLKSFSSGQASTASGNSSFAIGYLSIASGNFSFAGGGNQGLALVGGHATATGSFAFGEQTVASGRCSIVTGEQSTASGRDSVAIGFSTLASGLNAVAFSNSTIASGDYSVAIGFSTTASGDSATSLGSSSIASGLISTAMGIVTIATGPASTAIGSGTEASGDTSTAMGYLSIASGYVSTAMGRETEASGQYSIALGFSGLSNHYCEFSTSSGKFTNPGDCQQGVVEYHIQTTNATITELFLDGSFAVERFTLLPGDSYRVEITALAVDTSTQACSSFNGAGVIKNVAGTTSLVSAITMTQDTADAAMLATVVTVTADNTNDSLKIEGTGIAATNINWNVVVKYIKIAI